MLKKISVVLCAGLFATAFASGCKKDEKKDGEVSAASCDTAAAKIAAQMPSGDDAQKKATADFQVALAKMCKDDKWPNAALTCLETSKDPKVECKGKLSAEQDTKVSDLVKTMMAAGTTGAAMGSADAGMGTGSAAPMPGTDDGTMAGAGKFPATCQGVGDRAAADMGTDLPPGVPADTTVRISATITKRCTEDKWSADVISCGVTAANPRAECNSKLTPEQDAAMDKDMEALQKEMMESMAAAANAGGGSGGGGGSGQSGIRDCDEFLAAVAEMAKCDKLDADTRKGYEEMAGSMESLKNLPADQQSVMAEQCKDALKTLEETAKASGC